jgi:hypothetical protein
VSNTPVLDSPADDLSFTRQHQHEKDIHSTTSNAEIKNKIYKKLTKQKLRSRYVEEKESQALIAKSYDTRFDIKTVSTIKFDEAANCIRTPVSIAMINCCPRSHKWLCKGWHYVDDGLGGNKYRLACVGQGGGA